MRNGQQKRMRGRNRRGQNPMTRVYESNGPDVKIRGTAAHIAEKYVQLARDSQSSGDHVSAENYLQHAEHYFRLIAAAQVQFQQGQGFPGRPDQDTRDDDDDDDEPLMPGLTHPGLARLHEPQERPYQQDRQDRPYQPQQREQPRYPDQPPARYPDQPRFAEGQPQPAPGAEGDEQPSFGGLPSFITGGGAQPQGGYEGNGGGERGGERGFRRRRRHRFPPRADQNGGPGEGADGGAEAGPAPGGEAPTG